MNKQGLLLRLILTLILMCTNVGLYAYDVEVDGIYYNLNTNAKTAEVTRNNNERYEGNISIPESIFFNGKNYSVTSIGEAAFYYCNGLTSVIIPNCVTSFGFSAFQNCSGLTSITIPNNVTDIGDSAFSGCSGLTSITIPNNVTSICNNTFAYCSSLTSIVIPDNVTSIGNFAFYNCSSLTSIKIPNGVKSIGNSAFMRCIGLTTLTIPNSVTSIGNGAFYGCSGLSSITIPNSVTSIGSSAFAECSGLTSITIPNNITSIEHSTFSGCSSLTSITIPNGVKSIGAGAFMLCNGLTLITIPNSVTSIGGSAFAGCRSLTSITIPNSVTSIGEKAFMLCDGLTSITIPNGVTSIGDEAFSSCGGLISVISEIQNPFSITDNVFNYISSDAILQVPKGAKTKYEAFTGWTKNFKEIVESSSGQGFQRDIFNPIVIDPAPGTYNELPQQIRLTFDNYVKMGAGVVKFKQTDGTLSFNANVSVSDKVATVTHEHPYSEESTWSVEIPEGVFHNQYFDVDEVEDRWNAAMTITYKVDGTGAGTVVIPSVGLHPDAIHAPGDEMHMVINGQGIRKTTIVKKEQIFFMKNGEKVDFTGDILTPEPTENQFAVNTKGLTKGSYTIEMPEGTFEYDAAPGKTVKDVALKVAFYVMTDGSPQTYNLSITASGNGSVSYNNTSIRNNTQSFTVNEGASATVNITPDNGYRIQNVKLNNTDVTSSVDNNKYTINNISANTTLAVVFEAIPSGIDITQYISAVCIGGSITQTNDLINSGSKLNWTFSNNSTESVTLNSMQLIDGLTGSAGNIMNVNEVVNANSSVSYTTTIGATGIHTPVTCRFRYTYNGNEYSTDAKYTGNQGYTLSITSSGNGQVTYNGETIRNTTESYSVDFLSSATLTLTPDDGYKIKSVKVNNNDVTSLVTNSRYIINMITSSQTVEVEFEGIDDISTFTVDGVNYRVVSQSEKTVRVVSGNYGQVLTIPASVSSYGIIWTIVGVESDALSGNNDLVAIIWNPDATFTATVSNPNLLLYVKASQYAPSTIKNVVVNGTANSITLTDAASGNNFYCPQAFTAQKISYTHHYSMMTGIGESRGWETIALPFDVQKIEHAAKGTIVPFAQWRSGDTTKPFWLYELKSNGFVEASSIKANTPYIISMPNNPQYADQYQLVGNVTFSAENVTVSKSDNLQQPKYNDRTFVPNFQIVESDRGMYALNVNNDYVTNDTGMTEGSKFVMNMRKVHPFEAYMTTSSTNAPEFFDVFEGMTTDISEQVLMSTAENEKVYDLQGRRIIKNHLSKGIYIVNGQKIIIK